MIEIFDVQTFDYSEITTETDITTTDPDWTDILLLSGNRDQGTYKATFSLQFWLNSTSQSFMYRFSLDGGATWGPEYEKEVKDKHNIEVVEVISVIDHPGGDYDIRVQVTREGSADCTVKKAFISFDRKG